MAVYLGTLCDCNSYIAILSFSPPNVFGNSRVVSRIRLVVFQTAQFAFFNSVFTRVPVPFSTRVLGRDFPQPSLIRQGFGRCIAEMEILVPRFLELVGLVLTESRLWRRE